MIEYVCKYAPVEILEGFSLETALCEPNSKNFTEADKLTHRNLCSFSRALIESRMQKGDGPLLLTDCCDSMRRACDVLKTEGQKIFLLNLPHQSDGCGRLLYKNELLKLIADLTVYTGREFDGQRFKAACKTDDQKIGGPYVAVMGARVSEEVFSYIQQNSPFPVRNNTCTGLRQIGQAPDLNGTEELMDWYAGALLSQTPCMRMSDVCARKSLTQDPNLIGIIYHTVNFCDFYGFEYAKLKGAKTLPMLKIETDYTTRAAAQLKTRLDAFFEGLNGQKKAPAPQKQCNREAKACYTAGIDSGSTSTNVVILDEKRNIVSSVVLLTGAKVEQSAKRAFNEAVKKAGISKEQVVRTVTTGYGRANIGFDDKNVTEITCHAKGAHFLSPLVRTVIDIGGQDSKVIRLDENGGVYDFSMNDKCAAGTGRFLEMMAQSLGVTLEEIALCGLQWEEVVHISSMCSVFAQSEVVSLVAEGKRLSDIVHGLNLSVAAKVIALGGRSKMEKEYMMTGGVAKNAGVVRAIEEKLEGPVCVPKQPEICGALGAALIAWEDISGISR